ncbi:MAG: hypothetical protein O8C66_08740 [Candidatus Methanoperedens sp.]|nr:hypothetical protein [Candidatus Methanoperedens sp.]MCZ7370582.1 hypothetical protein [Candidatus Methanoperedens sp.]
MKAIYLFILLLIVALVSGCVDKKEQNLSTKAPGEILPASYVSEVEGNLTQMESMLNENEENFSTEVSASAFD